MRPGGADHERVHGDREPLPARVPLRAGPLALVLESGDLRSIRIGAVEVVNRIYGAVRDARWGTVPARLSDLQVETGPDWFRVGYTAEHRVDDGAFLWRADIAGRPDGTVAFGFRGRVLAGFARNRIGLCVLHPLRESLGLHATAHLTSGVLRPVRFPADVSAAQPVRGFENLRGLHWAITADLCAELTFDGDTFEMEDQRNWIDASFKTFGTPLSLPRPVWLPAGTTVDQRVTLLLHQRPPGRGPARVHVPRTLTPEREAPPVSLVGATVAGLAHSEADVDHLRRLGPSHLRGVLRLDDRCWRAELARVTALAAAVRCALELHVEIGDEPDRLLAALAEAVARDVPVARVLLFAAGQPVTTDAVLQAARRRLTGRIAAPLGSGSSGDLYQLHELAPPLADLTCWGMQPQAHATDVTSIAETPVAAGHQVFTVKRRRPGAVAVTPVRLSAAGPDPRQSSLFAAAWTLATLAEIVRYGAESATVFETVGPSGVLGPSGGVVPAYHVLADLCQLRAALARPIDAPDGVFALRARRGRSECVVAANLTRAPVRLRWPEGFQPVTARVLDERTACQAMRAPEAFRAAPGEAPEGGIELAAFATLRADAP